MAAETPWRVPGIIKERHLAAPFLFRISGRNRIEVYPNAGEIVHQAHGSEFTDQLLSLPRNTVQTNNCGIQNNAAVDAAREIDLHILFHAS